MAVDVISCDDIGGVGFGQQVAGSIVDIFGDDAVSCGFDTVADTVVNIAAGALANQAVGVVIGIVGSALGFELAFAVISQCGGCGCGQPVLLGVIAVGLAVVNQLFRQLRFGDYSFSAVAVGVQGVGVACQGFGACCVRELGQPVGIVVAISGLTAVELVGLGQPSGIVVMVGGGFS